MASNGQLAKAEDFRDATWKDRRQNAVQVKLPKCGRNVMLYRPKPLWWMFHGRLPQSFAARAAGKQNESMVPQTASELAEMASWIVAVLNEVFVEPRLALKPGPGEIAPDDLDMEDVNWIMRWAGGEIAEDGRDLGTFQGERSAAAGANGTDLRPASEFIT